VAEKNTLQRIEKKGYAGIFCQCPNIFDLLHTLITSGMKPNKNTGFISSFIYFSICNIGVTQRRDRCTIMPPNLRTDSSGMGNTCRISAFSRQKLAEIPAKN
jgi:hypothetical protein